MFETMTLLDAVRKDMESGIFDFTEDGKCSGCGSCCSNFLPMSSKEVKAIKNYVRGKGIKEQRRLFPFASQTIDATCPFRSESERKCLVYEVRPAICRDFQCDKPRKKIQAQKDMYHGKFQIVDMREEFFPKQHGGR